VKKGSLKTTDVWLLKGLNHSRHESNKDLASD